MWSSKRDRRVFCRSPRQAKKWRSQQISVKNQNNPLYKGRAVPRRSSTGHHVRSGGHRSTRRLHGLNRRRGHPASDGNITPFPTLAPADFIAATAWVTVPGPARDRRQGIRQPLLRRADQSFKGGGEQLGARHGQWSWRGIRGVPAASLSRPSRFLEVRREWPKRPVSVCASRNSLVGNQNCFQD